MDISSPHYRMTNYKLQFEIVIWSLAGQSSRNEHVGPMGSK